MSKRVGLLAITFASALAVFRPADAQATRFWTVHSFDVADGANPLSTPVLDANGALFGTTTGGGQTGYGTLFRLKGRRLTVLHSFGTSAGDGAYPWGRLTIDASGALLGTTNIGGAFGQGTIYHYGAASGLHIDYSFTGGEDGGSPLDGLTLGTDGNYYGSASYGGMRACGTDGTGSCGAVYMIDKHLRHLTTLHSFAGTDGAWPGSAPALRSGVLYGATFGGGASGGGSPFMMETDGTGFQVIAPTNGAAAFQSGLASDANGVLWGVAGKGGAYDTGGLYRIEADGTFTWAYSFPTNSGSYAASTPIFDEAGKLYGTLPFGGSAGCGEVYRYDPADGAFQILHDFDCTDGSNPWGSLAMDASGLLYGMTELGGAYGAGTIYAMRP